MSTARILDYNYIFDPTVTLTASSSDASFPSTNLRNHHRSAVWRTSGCFEITTSNQYLDFNDGADKAAMLSPGTYSPDELCTEIVTRMGALTSYTIGATYSDGAFTITSSSAITLEFSSGTNVASSVAPTIGFNAQDQSSATTHTGSNPAYHTSEWLEVDLRTIESIDSVAVIFNPLSSIGFSDAAVIKVQGNGTNNWSSPAVNTTLTIDSTYGVATHFYSSDQTYRYWRFYFSEVSNPNGYLEIPKLYLGKSTQIQNPNIGFSDTLTDQSSTTKTAYGQQYSDIYPQQRTFAFDFTALTAAETQTLAEIFERVGTITPIAFCLDPEATDFDKDRFFLYGYLSGNLPRKHVFTTYFDTNLTISEAF